MATDEQIGGNLIRLRGGQSQKDLADLMRQRGFRWSQATVWAVEKGERPLRLTEAEALGAVFGIHHQALLSTEDELELVFRLRELGELMDDITELAYKSFSDQRELAASIDLVPEGQLDDDITLEAVTRTAVEAAIEGLARADAHYRGSLDVGELVNGQLDRSQRKYAEAFDARVRDLVGAQEQRTSAALKGKVGDGLDQAEK